MPGIDNKVIYGDNLDLSGGSPVAAKLVTNGQIYIARTGLNPAVKQMSADFDFSGASDVKLTDNSNIIYVGKHGNDANDGKTIGRAKLTFGSAITAAAAIAPAVVYCIDDGTYTENITGVINVDIYAPNATFVGSHTLVSNNKWTIKEVTVLTGVTAFTYNSAGAAAYLKIRRITAAGTGIVLLTSAGNINLQFDCATIENGALISGASVGVTTVIFNDITVDGTGYIFGIAASGQIHAVGAIATDNTGAGTFAYSAAGAAAYLELMVNSINMAVLSNITAAIDARLTATYMTGALAQSGAGAFDMIGGATIIEGVPIGQSIAALGTFTSCTATNFYTADAAAGFTITGNTLSCDGTDANIDVELTPKGTGGIKIDGITTGYAGSEEMIIQSSVQTTDATATVIWALTLAEGEAVVIDALICGPTADHANTCAGRILYSARRAAAGAATQVAAAVSSVLCDSAATFSAGVNGNDVRVIVTGVNPITYNWTATIRYHKTLTNA